MKKFNIGDLVLVKFGYTKTNFYQNIIGIFIKEQQYKNYSFRVDNVALMRYTIFTSSGIVTTINSGIELL